MDKQNSKHRWAVLVIVIFTYFIIVSQRTAPGLVTNQLMQQYHLTAASIGLLASLQFFAYAGLQIPVGILSDRFGPNLFLIVGAFLNGAGTILYSLSPTASTLFIARLLVGIGDAAIWINVVLILSQWFKKNEFVGLLGIAGISGNFGFILATVPFSMWILHYGWQTPFLAAGAVISICALTLYIILVKAPKQKMVEKKSENKEKTSVLLKRIIVNRQAWATFLCHFGIVGSYVGFIGSWAVPYGTDVYHFSEANASKLILVGLIGALIGTFSSTWLSKKFNTVKGIYIPAHILAFAGWAMFFILGGKPSVPMLITLFLLIGFTNGANPLTFATIRNSFDLKEVGFVTGFANTGGFISAILLPIFFGKMLDSFQGANIISGYHYSFIIPIIFSFLGIIGGIMIKEKNKSLNN